VPVDFDTYVPPAAFASKAFSELFFTSKACLRTDQSTCFNPDSPYYSITHQGLDAMITRFIDEIHSFAKAPDNLAYPNHTAFMYIYNVVGAKSEPGFCIMCMCIPRCTQL
jgi:hypothetical protein